MPMTKKRRKMDKNKRRCLFSLGKKSKLAEPIENTVLEKSPVKNNKSGQIVDAIIENQSVEENNLIEKSKPKRQSADKSTIKDIIEQPKEEINEDVKKEIPLSKTPKITGQRYENVYFYEIKKMVFYFYVPLNLMFLLILLL